jgi:anti-sigma B factor antagonist
MISARFEDTRGVLVVTPLAPRLDAEAAPAFRAMVGDRVRGRALVVVSLAHVRSIDSSGLAGLVSLVQRMPDGGELRLSGACPSVRAMLASTRLDALFPVYDDAAAALAV